MKSAEIRKVLSVEQVLQIDEARRALSLAGRQAARSFLIWFVSLSIGLYVAVAVATSLYSTPAFSHAAFFGMILCTISSVISFFVTEWAFDQPKGVFMAVALGMVMVRMFNLLFAYTVGLFFLKFDPIGMVAGMLIAYFSYLVIEVLYVHNKGLLLGE